MLDAFNIVEHSKYKGRGRPKENEKQDVFEYQIIARSKKNDDAVKISLEKKLLLCFRKKY
ncbi:MAG: hypothetical protein K2X39_04535 [Silvanigrellaceae bacterium]|nr:hypothetical protein [Silvanigrellaceae bacterium]